VTDDTPAPTTTTSSASPPPSPSAAQSSASSPPESSSARSTGRRRLNAVPPQPGPGGLDARLLASTAEPAARLCDRYLSQWPAGEQEEGGPTATARAVIQEISDLPDPADSLLAMGCYAVALDAEIQAAMREKGKPAHSQFSKECDRHALLSFADDVLDACCVLIETLRTGSADRETLAAVDRHGYRAFCCLASICAHLAAALVSNSDRFDEYADVVAWLSDQHTAGAVADAGHDRLQSR
jgi:hypothetical protein